MRISSARAALALILLVTLLSVAACSSSSSEVTGSVGKLDRKGLPPNAVVNVELRDTSRQDAAALTISTDTIELDGDQLPVPYVLEYDEDEIIEANAYTVFVRIEADGTLLYITDTAYPVITRGNPTRDVEVLVVPVG
jgi:putative lipoprotein